MIIDSKLLKNDMISGKSKAFLIIVFLHYNKIMTDEKLKGMLKSLREDKLLTRRNVYHCSFSDRWYNEEHMSEILQYEFDTAFIKSKTIGLKDFMYYLNFYLNRNYNYCLNWIYIELIQPTLDNICNYSSISSLQSFRFFNINMVSYDDYPEPRSNSYWNYYGACDYYSKSDAYNDYVRAHENILKGNIIKEINSLKKGKWELSPHQLN